MPRSPQLRPHVFALALLLLLPACGDGDGKLPIGGTCAASSECESGLCGGGRCVDPELDDDGDGLINSYEVSILGTNPLAADSDGDGARDGDELSDQQNVDSDGDGKPDSLESASADADGDCIPDQYDADDAVNNSDLTPLFDVLCRQQGVCGVDTDLLSVQCSEGNEPFCDYGAVAGYEAIEATCDGLDNDCDGEIDEELPIGACPPQAQTLRVAPQTGSVWVTLSRPMTAFATFDDATAGDVTDEVAWAIAPTSVATIDAGGVLTAVSAGTATVTARLASADLVATATITVVGECPPGQELAAGACAGVGGDLVGHYRLDGDGQDSSGYFAHGTVTGATPTTDRFGSEDAAMAFCDGDRVEVLASKHPLGVFTGTYSFWIKPDRAAGASAALSAGALAPDARSSVALAGLRDCLEYVGEGNDVASDGGCVPADRWTHVAVTKDGRNVTFYFNGQASASGQTQAGQSVASARLLLGAAAVFPDGSVYEPLCAALDDVRIYKRVLSAAEIAALYDLGGWGAVGSAGNPARGCDHVLDSDGAATTGRYWLDPDGDGAGPAFEATCDMTTEGGGWTLAYVYGFTDYANFEAVTNAVTPRPGWPATQADVPISTTAPVDGSTLGAIDWALWRYIGDEIMATSNVNDHVLCTPDGGSLSHGLGGPMTCRVVAEVNPACDGVAPTGLGWGPHGPSIGGPELHTYWDGFTGDNWPTHDPCASNAPNQLSGVASPGGAVWLRDSAWEPEDADSGQPVR